MQGRLRRQRDSLWRTAAGRLAADPTADLEPELARLKRYDAMLAAAPRSSWKEPLAAFAVAFVCVTAVGLAWTTPRPPSPVAGVLTTQAVSGTLAEAWQLPAGATLAGGGLRVREAAAALLPTMDGTGRRIEGPVGLVATAGRVRVEELMLDAGAEVTIERTASGALDVFVGRRPARATLAVAGAVTLAIDGEPGPVMLTAEPPELLELAASGGAVPIQLRLEAPAELDIGGLRLERIGFIRPRGGAAFESAIQGGDLGLADVDRRVTIARGDRLVLADPDLRVRVRGEAGELSVALEGRVGRLLVGPEGQERDRSPVWLEWLMANKQLYLLWTGLVGAWGLLWSARKLLAGAGRPQGSSG